MLRKVAWSHNCLPAWQGLPPRCACRFPSALRDRPPRHAPRCHPAAGRRRHGTPCWGCCASRPPRPPACSTAQGKANGDVHGWRRCMRGQGVGCWDPAASRSAPIQGQRLTHCMPCPNASTPTQSCAHLAQHVQHPLVVMRHNQVTQLGGAHGAVVIARLHELRTRNPRRWPEQNIKKHVCTHVFM